MIYPKMILFTRCFLFVNITKTKTLISGRNREEQEYRHFMRREIFPKIIFEVFDL